MPGSAGFTGSAGPAAAGTSPVVPRHRPVHSERGWAAGKGSVLNGHKAGAKSPEESGAQPLAPTYTVID